MTTEERPMTYTDEQIIRRAIDLGVWELFEDVTDRWPGSTSFPATGWLKATGAFQHANGGRTWRLAGDGATRIEFDAIPANFARAAFDHDNACDECGLLIDSSSHVTRSDGEHCWRCKFWLDRIDRIGRDPRAVIARRDDDGPGWYWIGHNTTPSHFNGFGGAWFDIEFLDGRTVRTCDLWYGGTIPERFHDRFPVNARFNR